MASFILCECSWGIPGVDRLPPHMHRSWARVRHNGREFTMNKHDVALNPGLDVLDQGEDVDISVNWKSVTRAMVERMAS